MRRVFFKGEILRYRVAIHFPSLVIKPSPIEVYGGSEEEDEEERQDRDVELIAKMIESLRQPIVHDEAVAAAKIAIEHCESVVGRSLDPSHLINTSIDHAAAYSDVD